MKEEFNLSEKIFENHRILHAIHTSDVKEFIKKCEEKSFNVDTYRGDLRVIKLSDLNKLAGSKLIKEPHT